MDCCERAENFELIDFSPDLGAVSVWFISQSLKQYCTHNQNFDATDFIFFKKKLSLVRWRK